MENKKLKSSSANDDYQWITINDPSVIFTTYDLGASTALLCAGFELLSVDKVNPRKALFIFRKTSGIEDAANQYFSDQLRVGARSFFDNLRALKNRLYSE